ncbi:hypothetical protein VITFI_CDS1515 [Vitreoscilla filiformis]|uniref:Integrase catalytic domain-containing protein n=1 Tax=Vitreoscilla filiformis TaxID=63 RepID=A0A221KA64_VITFI|nr:DDE-type integrase/transposase/recombinase [Vitreoscilla filiformis]ASM75784.1 hypothetical protein VITFI_CDS0005 [Vitreoscilla filiformis]ASM75908.1 hypothetical protein VITFI_CDS0129 [Vitreoscilla filiformis]ASM76418.1 hypothetical protein VITFI_CDS0639 [Vitreoscilla filiformis]ASM76858.1 hypothetical protein VITFI_CDS1080 [Vitreoscilla filiformis]ASM77293.1 hypothetical protein VITFI_CDS1515 [Vitreoscilla filiformis]
MPPSHQISADQVLYLHEVRTRLDKAAHGECGAIADEAAAQLGVTRSTIHRLLAEQLGRDTGRKRRSDAGKRGVTHDELMKISAALMGTFRRKGINRMTADDAVELLRHDTVGLISTQLSTSRLLVLLREAGLHPDQLRLPEPAIQVATEHPNQFWQVDASVCVVYYLSNATGLQVMDEKKFYKNKPANITRVQEERLIRYTAADVNSHDFLTRYYLGSESAANLGEFLIWAFGDKGGRHPMHGVPLHLEFDPGAANTSAPVLNLCERLKSKVLVHERHRSRSNGSVEKAHHLVEIHFELASLRFAKVASLDDLNDKALLWSHWYCGTKNHSRYGRPRHAQWLTITADQLRIAPPADVMRRLMRAHPIKRKVDTNLEITFALRGADGKVSRHSYRVRHLPGVKAGDMVPVVADPYHPPSVEVGYVDGSTGRLAWMPFEAVTFTSAGYATDAPQRGQELRAAPRGLLDVNRDAVVQTAYGGDTLDEAKERQEKGGLVFAGQVDPFAMHKADAAQLPTYMPKRGHQVAVEDRAVSTRRLTVPEACQELKRRLGERYTPQVYGWVQARFGADGVPEDQLETLAEQLAPSAPAAQPVAPMPLRAVGGL